MTKNGNGYVQVLKGPDGEPMVLLRLSDFLLLAERAMMRATRGMEAHRKDLRKNKFVELSGILESSRASMDAAKLLDWVVEKDHSHFTQSNIFRTLIVTDNDTSDSVAFREAKASLESGNDELLPGDMAKRLLDGQPPLRVWREYRGLTQAALHEVTGVSQSMISNIETGKRTGDVATLKKLADALDVLVDDLVL